MTVEQGWYHYPGDPEGSVRLWNGSEWVGFPTQPPPGHDSGSHDRSRHVAGSNQRVVGRAFKNQVRLAPYAVLAVLGLAATAVFAFQALQALRSEVDALLGRDRRFLDRDSILLSPSQADTYRQLFIVAVIGGVLFLIWLWRANANIGGRVEVKRNTGAGWGLKWLILGVLFLLIEAIFRTVFGPIITRMSNCVERSTPGGSGGMGLTLANFLWWMLWVLSGVAFMASAIALADESMTSRGAQIETWATVATGALVAHIVSLVLGIVLVVNITMQQDRRLA